MCSNCENLRERNKLFTLIPLAYCAFKETYLVKLVSLRDQLPHAAFDEAVELSALASDLGAQCACMTFLVLDLAGWAQHKI